MSDMRDFACRHGQRASASCDYCDRELAAMERQADALELSALFAVSGDSPHWTDLRRSYIEGAIDRLAQQMAASHQPAQEDGRGAGGGSHE